MTLPRLALTLRQLRQARALSQLELSLRLGVSQRHISFVERGRSRPSRALLQAWLSALDARPVARRAALMQAGHAVQDGAPGPAPEAPHPDPPPMAALPEAVLQWLHAQDPMPALLLNPLWQVLHLNRGARWLVGLLAPETQTPTPAAQLHVPLDLLDLLMSPQGLSGQLLNLAEVAPIFLQQLEDEQLAHPALAPRVSALRQAWAGSLGPGQDSWRPAAPGAGPTPPLRLATRHGELAFHLLYSTVGSPLEIGSASLRVEHLLAADEHTRQVLRAQVPL